MIENNYKKAYKKTKKQIILFNKDGNIKNVPSNGTQVI